MALIIRIDVDRPFGKKNIFRRIISRIRSELYFPKIEKFGYLDDLKKIISLLNSINCRSYIFFRRCTMPTKSILEQIKEGGHIIGLHLENTRNYTTFKQELSIIQKRVGCKINSISKHGSGFYKYGLFHHAPYEPQRYIEWAISKGMKLFFGNLEDPSIKDYEDNDVHVFPAAFWLEPHWRNTKVFTIDWLIENAQNRDIIMLFHPDNVTVDPKLYDQLTKVIRDVPTKVFD